MRARIVRLSRSRCFAAAALALLVGCASVTSTREQTSSHTNPPVETFSELLGAFVDEHCSTCHKGETPKAGLNLVEHAGADPTLETEAVWESVLDMLRRGAMPPEDEPRPDEDFVVEVMERIDGELTRIAASVEPDPGRVTARRLNRVEYANTVRDLLGVRFDATDEFPTDDSGYGFDTIADVLTMSPLLMEKYFSAAEHIAADAIPIENPNDEKSTERYARVFTCGHEMGAHTPACARNILRPLAAKSYRRPVTRKEVAELVSFVELVRADGGSFEQGMRLAVEAILVSPQFLFRIERDRSPGDPDTQHPISAHELASRLSYFLWSSMPDDELFALAADETLGDPAVLEAQVRRMLADEKSGRLVENFAGQWLELRNLPLTYRDDDLFPDFSRDLLRDMGRETRMYFGAIVEEDRSLLEFLDSEYTFLNDRLARHYGIEGVTGDEFRRVSLEGDERGGILTQASLLTLTAYPTRTSPVLRGKWILENLLGTPPPPPPADVPAFPENKKNEAKSVRERLEQHRANPTCASCHVRMDGLGFGLENFDAIGQWRETDGSAPVDSSGELPTGERFSGPAELRSILLDHKDAFVHTLTEKMLTYALGRGLERYDRPVIEKIAASVAADDYRFSSLVLGIVESMPFQMRRGDGKGKA